MWLVKTVFLLGLVGLSCGQLDTCSGGEDHEGSHWTKKEYNIGHLHLSVSGCYLEINLSDRHGREVGSGILGKSVFSQPARVTQAESTSQKLSLQVPNELELELEHYDHGDGNCVDVSWKATSCLTSMFLDCYPFKDAHWYGGAEMQLQEWPIEKAHQDFGPYIGEDTIETKRYGSVQERLFFSSKGMGIYIEEDIPLFVSINKSGDNSFCFKSQFDNYYYSTNTEKPLQLKYTLCAASDVRKIHQMMSTKYIEKPTGLIHRDLFRYPIWSTWAEYKTMINQSEVINFVAKIKANNLPISQIEIDDDWTIKYGDLRFNETKFPDAKSLVDALHKQNIPVTLWVHPFVDLDAEPFVFLASKGWLMKDISGKRPALVSWWNGLMSSHIDFSNPDAAEWYMKELQSLQRTYGIDSFKFDAGDTSFMPPVLKSHRDVVNKNQHARFYLNSVFESDPVDSRIEFRVGFRTQRLPVMVRMLDKFSTWSLDNGLKSVITTALVFGVIGYPFVLPDYIGGNEYNNKVDSELFIRWIQANALLPVMQFSIAPWRFDKVVLEVAQEMVTLHEKYADKIISLAEESVVTGHPIVRPLWWIAPEDESALTVDDQFLLGNDLLVAPVLEPGTTVRRVYIPAGRWRYEKQDMVYQGENWFDIPVTLRDLPFFQKLD